MRKDERYVSITQMHPRAGVNRWAIFWRCRRLVAHARRAPGNLFSEMHRTNGAYYTLTVWDNGPALRRFLRNPITTETWRDVRNLTTGKAYGFASEGVPTWPEAIALSARQGTPFGTSAETPPEMV